MEPWPSISYEAFKPTLHLLHMGAQAMGKLKLKEPFEPHWDGVCLWLTSRGFTTGPLNYHFGVFSIEMDFIDHQVICMTSWGGVGKFALGDMSVATLVDTLFNTLHSIGIDASVNLMPMEIPDPIPFNEDTTLRPYNATLTQQWWHIMLSTQRVMQRHHAQFNGRTPPIGLMWGTLDLRDVRYFGAALTVPKDIDYIRRNAMDTAQIEIGWWCGNPLYPRPAFFAFAYPEPPEIAQAKIKPSAARWENTLKEFILDYDTLIKSKQPDEDLLSFFKSTYQASAKLAGWDSSLRCEGKPI
jgi:hypothetical protein